MDNGARDAVQSQLLKHRQRRGDRYNEPFASAEPRLIMYSVREKEDVQGSFFLTRTVAYRKLLYVG